MSATTRIFLDEERGRRRGRWFPRCRIGTVAHFGKPKTVNELPGLRVLGPHTAAEQKRFGQRFIALTHRFIGIPHRLSTQTIIFRFSLPVAFVFAPSRRFFASRLRRATRAVGCRAGSATCRSVNTKIQMNRSARRKRTAARAVHRAIRSQ